MPDYTKMQSGDMLYALGKDGAKWTDAFRQHFPNCNVPDDTMLGWFCNAIMAGYDAAQGNPPLNGDHAEFLLDKEGLTNAPQQ